MNARALAFAAALAAPLAAVAQPAAPGLDLYLRPDKGHCIACHQLPEGAGPAVRADLGPKLEGTRMRALGPKVLRERIENPVPNNANTVMPPYGAHRILDAAEITRLVEFLLALPAAGPEAPAGEAAVPAVPDQAADTARIIAAGRQLFERRFKDGRTLATCFPNGGRRVAGSYPLYDARLKRVVTLETAINQCLKAHGEETLDPQEAPMARLTAYLRTLSDGQKMAVRVPAAAKPRLEQGRVMYLSRMGQRNYACASCHVIGAGKVFAEATLSPAAGQATHWPVIRDGAPLTLHMRIRECLELMGAAPFPSGSEELTHLELYLASLSNGMPLKANPSRAPSKPTASGR